ncbi:MAG: bifunctional phosphoglucose/phosphomannose isomerase [Thermoleophilia bacterium]|nr:bifunctional phosphoglucose/phosphomannose isomerase [Thermoleophilia bacterium]
MSVLDDGGFPLDSLGLMDAMGGSAEAFDDARRGARAVALPWRSGQFRSVCIAGMGGSAIAADLVLGAWREALRVPAAAQRDYTIPGWVGPETLMILSSYSGDTEETLTAAAQATEDLVPCVAITSGGKLGGRYRDMGVPVIDLPPGLQPRAALLRLLVPLVVTLDRVGVIPSADADLDDARASVVRAVAEWGPDVPTERNPAKRLAFDLLDTVPVFWGAEATAPMAQRFKGQVNENAKVPAYWGVVPEVNHNEICGFEGMGAFGSLCRLVFLRDPRQHRQVGRRFTLTRRLVEPDVGGVIEIEARGETPLGRLVDLVMLADYATLYLAALRGVDPGPVEAIGRLKEMLTTERA